MKSVLFIGSRKKYYPFVCYCQKKKYRFLIFEAVSNLENACLELDSLTQYNGYNSFFNLDYYIDYFENIQFKPDIVVNQRDQKNWLELEWKLVNFFSCSNFFDIHALKFFSLKSEQNRVCKSLSIPTIPLIEGNIIVKKDAGFSGGTGFKRTTLKSYQPQKNEFIQSEISIDYTIGVHIYIDFNKDWHLLNYHQLKYHDNCPVSSQAPYSPTFQEEAIIKKSIASLSKKINVSQRLVFWQFVKARRECVVGRGGVYSMDFNCRVSGGYESGSYDTDVSDADWPKILIENCPPEKIVFHSQVRCVYNKRQLFGYSDLNRYKEAIKLKDFITRI